MYFEQSFILVALLAAAMSVQAKVGTRSNQDSDGGRADVISLRNTAKAKECSKSADHGCPGGGQGHQIVFAQCMAVYWKSIARTHKSSIISPCCCQCPYPRLSLLQWLHH
ncbi:hypothetical protein V8E36_006805 [Tilletia maclaganii]